MKITRKPRLSRRPRLVDGIRHGNVELRHLRYFVVVAEELNLRRAADRLEITQPALTKQVAGLEEQMGVSLLRDNDIVLPGLRRRVPSSLSRRATYSNRLTTLFAACSLLRTVARGGCELASPTMPRRSH